MSLVIQGLKSTLRNLHFHIHVVDIIICDIYYYFFEKLVCQSSIGERDKPREKERIPHHKHNEECAEEKN